MSLTPPQKIAAARRKARQKAPYWHTALCGLIPYETAQVPTIGVSDDWVMAYNPEFINTVSVSDLAGVLAHELSHLLRYHLNRGVNAGAVARVDGKLVTHNTAESVGLPQLWNVACDAAINDGLLDVGWTLPDGGITSSLLGMPSGEMPEFYYSKLKEQTDDQRQQLKNLLEQMSAGVGAGQCGSAAGNPGEWEATAPGGKSEGDADERPEGRGPGEARQIVRQTAEDMQRALQRGIGNIPSGWDRWVDATLSPPKIPWREKLATRVRRIRSLKMGMRRRSMDRPSRRQYAMGYGKGSPLFPRWRSPNPRVVVALDTSGSMGREEIADALVEINGVLNTSAGRNIGFMACDCESYGVKEVRSMADLKPLIKGGGGTDFHPIFEEVDKLSDRARPDILIIVTDGGGGCPDKAPPHVSVLWVLVGDHRTDQYIKHVGEVIEVD